MTSFDASSPRFPEHDDGPATLTTSSALSDLGSDLSYLLGSDLPSLPSDNGSEDGSTAQEDGNQGDQTPITEPASGSDLKPRVQWKDLPVELQHIIWCLAIPSRNIRLVPTFVGGWERLEHRRLISSEPLPNVLAVNHQSRIVTRRYYRTYMGINYVGPKAQEHTASGFQCQILINPDLDSVAWNYNVSWDADHRNRATKASMAEVAIRVKGSAKQLSDWRSSGVYRAYGDTYQAETKLGGGPVLQNIAAGLVDTHIFPFNLKHIIIDITIFKKEDTYARLPGALHAVWAGPGRGAFVTVLSHIHNRLLDRTTKLTTATFYLKGSLQKYCRLAPHDKALKFSGTYGYSTYSVDEARRAGAVVHENTARPFALFEVLPDLRVEDLDTMDSSWMSSYINEFNLPIKVLWKGLRQAKILPTLGVCLQDYMMG